jgi:hypothetical protein
MFAACLYLSQKSLDLELALANASGLISMQLSEDYFTRSQANPSNAFTLAPSSAAVSLAQTGQLADTRARSNGLDRRELADDLEVHDPIVAKMDDLVKWARARGLTFKLTGDRRAGASPPAGVRLSDGLGIRQYSDHRDWKNSHEQQYSQAAAIGIGAHASVWCVRLPVWLGFKPFPVTRVTEELLLIAPPCFNSTLRGGATAE